MPNFEPKTPLLDTPSDPTASDESADDSCLISGISTSPSPSAEKVGKRGNDVGVGGGWGGDVFLEGNHSQKKPGGANVKGDFLTRYNLLLDSRPLLTKSLTAAVVQGLGAALASLWIDKSTDQRMDRLDVAGRHPRAAKKKKSSTTGFGGIDWIEVFAFALHGALVNGPVGHHWFEWLSKHGPQSTFKSMLLDQLVINPPLLVLMFVFLDVTRAGMREIRPSLDRTLSTVGPTLLTSWRFWPVAVLCIFRFLKRKHYTVSLNLCSLAWTMYLSKRRSS